MKRIRENDLLSGTLALIVAIASSYAVEYVWNVQMSGYNMLVIFLLLLIGRSLHIMEIRGRK